jgi:hypothetical protein
MFFRKVRLKTQVQNEDRNVNPKISLKSAGNISDKKQQIH